MVLSLVEICATEVVRDHSSSPLWLRCVPRELYRPLLDAAVNSCRPLAIGELVQRWPDRSLRVGGKRKPGQNPPNRQCTQALLLAIVRGLADQSSSLQVLDLSGLQSEDGGGTSGDPMGSWSLTVALCTAMLQAQRGGRKRRGLLAAATAAETGVATKKRERDQTDVSDGEKEGGWVQGVRRRMELQRKSGGVGGQDEEEEEGGGEEEEGVALHVRADLFVNARSWERVRLALSSGGPLRLQCVRLRVEELPASAIGRLLDLLPHRPLVAVDVRYSNLGVTGLATLLPRLGERPALRALRLHYCGLDASGGQPGLEGALWRVARGLEDLKALRSLSLTAVRLPGRLRTLLSSLAMPLEDLELPYLSLQPCDLAYLSCSHHIPALLRLDLSDNRLDVDGPSLPSLRRLLAGASATLRHLALSGCSITQDQLGALLPALRGCRALESLAMALNPLTLAGMVELVRTADRMPRLRRLLYPALTEEDGSPGPPAGAEPPQATRGQLHCVLDSCRTDLFLTFDPVSYDQHLAE